MKNLLFLLVILWGCGDASTQNKAQPTAAPSLQVRKVAPPGTGGHLAPELTTLSDGTPVLSWLERLPEGYSRFVFAEWNGEAFNNPIEIARGTNWYQGKADVPGLISGPDNALLAHYRINSYGDFAYGIRVMVSHDNGRTWLPPIRPHENNTQAEFGFFSAIPKDNGSFLIAWLDGRETMLPTPDGKGKMPTTLRTAMINKEGKMEDEQIRDNRVCDCCPTAAIPYGSDGLLVYRDRSEEEVRDIRLLAPMAHQDLAEGTFPKDNWQVQGCPVNGPTAVMRDEKHAAIGWFTASDNKPKVQIAFSEQDYQFGKAILLDSTHVRGRIDLAPWGQNIAACWVVSDGKKEKVKIAEIEWQTGKILTQSTYEPESRLHGNPKLVSKENTLIMAWPVIDSLPHIEVGVIEKK